MDCFGHSMFLKLKKGLGLEGGEKAEGEKKNNVDYSACLAS